MAADYSQRMSCVFCTDITKSGDVVLETAHAWVVLHEDWAVPGHAMIVSRRHVENASDLTEHEWKLFSEVWRRAERALLSVTEAERAIVMKLGIATPHLHVHIYPVAKGATREEVFEAIEGKTKGARNEALVEGILRRLRGSG
jgi:diadenosine tetraphosphate (Ap4A) HIT family hydrolase